MAIEIFVSQVKKSAPHNAAGSRVGFGTTKGAAGASAAHWNNQAAHAKCTRGILFDCDSANKFAEGSTNQLFLESFAMFLSDMSEFDCRAADALKLLVSGKAASAAQKLIEAGFIK